MALLSARVVYDTSAGESEITFPSAGGDISTFSWSVDMNRVTLSPRPLAVEFSWDQYREFVRNMEDWTRRVDELWSPPNGPPGLGEFVVEVEPGRVEVGMEMYGMETRIEFANDVVELTPRAGVSVEWRDYKHFLYVHSLSLVLMRRARVL